MKIVEDALISDLQSTSMKSFETKKSCNIEVTMPLATNLYVDYNDTWATKPYLKKYGKVSFERLNPFINPWFWRLYKFWKKNFDFSSKEKILLVLPDFLNNLFLFKVKNIRWILSTFCSMVKLCRDNPLVPFTVCHPNFCQSNEKMDKIIRLSVCLVGFYHLSSFSFPPVPICFRKLIILHVKNIFQSWDWQEDWMQLTPAAPRVADLMQNGKSQKFE